MRIAILDYIVTRNNAIGNCDRRIVEGLKDEHQFTVFSVEFDNPDPARIEHVRIPAIRKPLFALYVSYHLLAPLIVWNYQRRHRVRFDVVQSVESNTLMGTLVYAHFCHRGYLEDHWQSVNPGGLRGFARWLDHRLHALLEPPVYRKAQQVVVPSKGLAGELMAHYGALIGDRMQVVPNPVDIERLHRPADFDRASRRAELELDEGDLVLLFIALGHFERKGLPLLMEAVKQVNDPRVKILVVGGTPGIIRDYTRRAEELGIEQQMVFAGYQQDTRPFMWMSDLFAFPSAYETFSLVALESAAAGLPLLITRLHGVEEYLTDGENGWCVPRSAAAFAEKIRLALADPDTVRQMGHKAEQSATSRYDVSTFVQTWRELYAALAK